MNRSERRAAAQAQRPQVQVAQPPGLHKSGITGYVVDLCNSQSATTNDQLSLLD